jgi:hypothetical protein
MKSVIKVLVPLTLPVRKKGLPALGRAHSNLEFFYPLKLTGGGNLAQCGETTSLHATGMDY